VCVLVVLITARCQRSSRSPAAVEPPARGAYRPGHLRDAATQPLAVTADRQDHAADRSADRDPPLTPDLEQRLRAAATVRVVAPRPAGDAAPPPRGSLPPAEEASRRQALTRWTAAAQRQLDGCVARPQPLRQPVRLDVFFSPPVEGTGYVAQQLSPAAIAVPPDDLRRLWRDTDPDALQVCIERLRMQALAVPAAAGVAPRTLPASVEAVVVTL
jgi:hypothetical protein